MSGIYVLKLESGKYYIGWSSSIKQRLLQHFEGHGSQWTSMHKPIELIELICGASKKDEMMKTLHYMSIYGSENVRGGPWSTVDVDCEPVRLLRHLNDQCYSCGAKSHLSDKCPKRQTTKYQNGANVKCVRCGKTDHCVTACVEILDTQGKRLSSGPVCYKCGKSSHYANKCRVKM